MQHIILSLACLAWMGCGRRVTSPAPDLQSGDFEERWKSLKVGEVSKPSARASATGVSASLRTLGLLLLSLTPGSAFHFSGLLCMPRQLLEQEGLRRIFRPAALCAVPNKNVEVGSSGDSSSSSLELLQSTMRENELLREKVRELEDTITSTEGLCEVLDDGGGWTSSLPSRASWLLGLLLCQSFSSFILADNENLLMTHPTVIYFMTMLVGAGGNAGNQASVRIIRGLATGEVAPDLSERTRSIISDELIRAVALGLILVVAGFVRVVAFKADVLDAIAISASLFAIVSSSVVFGTLLPLLLQALKIDAANASTTIQVIMDVLGVLITCTVAPLVFSSMLPEQLNGFVNSLPALR